VRITVTDAPATLVVDVDEADFQTAVLDRSHEVPVVVDFWAAWCGPCRTLGPMLEQAVAARNGEVALAKVDVDRNQALAQAFRVQGIPQVLGFRDGKVVSQFTGVVPAPQLAAFLDELAPSEADRAVVRARALGADAREAELRRALELDPGHREAAIGLADLLIDRDPDAALDLVSAHRPDPAAEAIVTRVELARRGGGDVEALRQRADAGEADGDTLLELGRALAARGAYDEAIERLLAAVELGGDTREPAREQLVALFGVLGDDDRVRAARPRLARALF
jgi:putative thioredoxin